MDEGLKKRLIGAAVLASLVVVFVPMLFEEPPSRPPPLAPLPPPPPVRDFAAEMLRAEVPAVTPLAPREAPPLPLPPSQPEPAGPKPANTPPAPASPAPELAAWVVQAASLKNRRNAEKLVVRLREAALPTPDPEQVHIGGERYYRVRVGPVVERAEAEDMREKVSKIAGTRAQVQRHR